MTHPWFSGLVIRDCLDLSSIIVCTCHPWPAGPVIRDRLYASPLIFRNPHDFLDVFPLKSPSSLLPSVKSIMAVMMRTRLREVRLEGIDKARVVTRKISTIRQSIQMWTKLTQMAIKNARIDSELWWCCQIKFLRLYVARVCLLKRTRKILSKRVGPRCGTSEWDVADIRNGTLIFPGIPWW